MIKCSFRWVLTNCNRFDQSILVDFQIKLAKIDEFLIFAIGLFLILKLFLAIYGNLVYSKFVTIFTLNFEYFSCHYFLGHSVNIENDVIPKKLNTVF